MSNNNLHDLAQRWYAHMVANMDKLSVNSKIKLEDYGLGGHTPFDAEQAMQEVLSTDPVLEQEIQDTLGLAYEGVCHIFLLMWLQTQETPGHKKLNMAEVVSWWPVRSILCNAESHDPREPDLRKAHAMVICAHAVCGTISYEQGLELFKPLVELLSQKFDPLYYRYTVQEYADFYVDLGHCALIAVGYPNHTSGHIHEKTWVDKLRASFPQSATPSAMVLINTIATSDLPQGYKLRALSKLNPGMWCHPDTYPHLLTLLPTEENRRIELLPWHDIPIFLATMNSAATFATHAMGKNKGMVELYCPSLFGLVDLVCDPMDWGDKNKIMGLADRFSGARADGLVQASFELPFDASMGM